MPKPGSGKNLGSRVRSGCFALDLARWVSSPRFSEVENLNPWEKSGFPWPWPMRTSASESGPGSRSIIAGERSHDQPFGPGTAARRGNRWGAGTNVPDFTLPDETNRAVIVERPDALRNRGSCEFFVSGSQVDSVGEFVTPDPSNMANRVIAINLPRHWIWRWDAANVIRRGRGKY
jgi:hypothetical protein